MMNIYDSFLWLLHEMHKMFPILKSVVYDIFQSVKVSSVRNKSLKLFLLNLNYFLGFHKFAMRAFEMLLSLACCMSVGD